MTFQPEEQVANITINNEKCKKIGFFIGILLIFAVFSKVTNYPENVVNKNKS